MHGGGDGGGGLMSGHLELWNVSKAYETARGKQVVVRDFTLDVAKDEFVTLIGHSGCGKSTVLSMVAGLTDPSGGGIVLAGREIDGPGPDRGVVFQAPCLLPWMTALENVLLGIDQVFADRSPAERRMADPYYRRKHLERFDMFR
jgi:ABC-type nitrate/sulfonate/bicarbonate transport system ATPase subunit